MKHAMEHIFNIIAGPQADTCCILLYGEIGSYGEVKAQDIVTRLMEAEQTYRKIDVRINSVGGAALGFSTGCKVSTTAETGERVTKEASSGKWKEKFVKSFSESISADGCILTDGDTDTPTYDQLKDLMVAGLPVEAAYSLRDGDKRTGKTAGGYKGSYIITSLEGDAQAGDDGKYSITLENSGPVNKIGGGLGEQSEIG